MAYEDDDDFVLPPNLTGENAFDLPAITNSVREMLRAIGEDPEREGLVRTPERVARAYQEILGGYNTDTGSTGQWSDCSRLIMMKWSS